MNSDRARLLGELLQELADYPKGFIPNEAWYGVQKAFALSYVELAVVRRDLGGQVQILLTHRMDKDWTGWHVPGGIWRTRQTLEESIFSLARSEFGGDAQLTLLARGGWEKWHNHPYGYPISHIAICSATDIVETDSRKWFSGVPTEMIDDGGHHANYIREVLVQAQGLV